MSIGVKEMERNFDFTTSIPGGSFSFFFFFTSHVSATRGPSRCDAPTCSRVKVVSVVRPLSHSCRIVHAEASERANERERAPVHRTHRWPLQLQDARRGSTNKRSLVHPRPDSAAFRVHQPGRPPSREAPSAMPNTARTRAAATRRDANSCGQIPLRPLAIMRIFVRFALFRSSSSLLSLFLSLFPVFLKFLDKRSDGTFDFPLIQFKRHGVY